MWACPSAATELLVPVTFTTGLDYENMSERRKGYENYVLVNGAPLPGVT
jgi:iron complex outermembrane receptor protein